MHARYAILDPFCAVALLFVPLIRANSPKNSPFSTTLVMENEETFSFFNMLTVPSRTKKNASPSSSVKQ